MTFSLDDVIKSTDMQYKMPEFEQHFLHTFAIIVYECIIKDKVSLLPLWLHIIKSLKVIEEQPNSYSVWQIKLVSSQMLRKRFEDDVNTLLGTESMLAIKQKIAIILDKWEHGIYYDLRICYIINFIITF